MKIKRNYFSSCLWKLCPVLTLVIFSSLSLGAAERLTLVVTGNMGGRFDTKIENQEKNDSLIKLGQSIAREKRKKNCIYLDLGNAFYPGIVSKYSYGSAIMDFLSAFECDATVISSDDLQVGLGNLRYMNRGKKTSFLSSNLFVNKKTFFRPYFLHSTSRGKIAFIGVSSGRLQVDATEQTIQDVSMKAHVDAVREAVESAKKEGAKYFVLLSGLSFKENFSLLKELPVIGLVISGGDNNGKLFGRESLEIKLKDGRSIAILPEYDGYLKAEIDLDGKLALQKANLVASKNYAVKDNRYRDFIKRISGWKKQLRRELDVVQYDTGKRRLEFNAAKCADLLRKEYSAEVVLLDRKAVTQSVLQGKITKLKLNKLINTEFPIVTFRLKGSEVKLVAVDSDLYLSRGYKDGKVQGYAVNDKRLYRIAATQSVLKVLEKKLFRKIEYQNTLKNILQTVSSDLKGDRFLVKGSEKQVDNTFRFLTEFNVAFVFENSLVKGGNNIDVPVGRPLETYTRYGVESTVNFILYNRLHYFELTPYIHYVRQGDTYLSNLLRGTFYYKLNLPYFVNPYHKSQLDTVVADVAGERPTIIRETIGATILTKYLTGKTGFGIEKELVDPEGSVVYGIEALLSFNITFLKYMTYKLGIDAFVSLGDISRDKRYIRSELLNGLTFTLNSSLSISVKHVLFFYYSMSAREHYMNSQIVTMANYKTDFKIW